MHRNRLAAAEFRVPPPLPPPAPIDPAALPPAKEDRFRDWLQGAMERARIKTGDLLRKSPAWHHAVENLQLSL